MIKENAKGYDLYFDLETVPDETRLEELEQAKAIGQAPGSIEFTDAAKMPKDLEGFLARSIGDIETDLATFHPVPVWLDELEQKEKTGKTRKGVYDAIDKERKAVSSQDRETEARNKTLATCPETLRIVAAGYAIDGGSVLSWVDNPDKPGGEAIVLAALWKLIKNAGRVVGFNVARFDLPAILTRSAILGVTPSRDLTKLKPWDDFVLDLYLARFGNRGNTDAKKPGTLKKLAACYGVPVPAGDFHGGQVAGAMQTPEGRELLAQYVKSDVEVTRALHKKFDGYFC